MNDKLEDDDVVNSRNVKNALLKVDLKMLKLLSKI